MGIDLLDLDGKPRVATATFVVDANSANIIESKSLKLYLNSYSMTRFAAVTDVSKQIAADLSATAAAPVDITVNPDPDANPIATFPGRCIDGEEFDGERKEVDAGVLRCDRDQETAEILYSHLLRSNCPVTNQPDMGSIMIEYAGPKISATSLLNYIVSYRQHNDFHEACVERMFLDIRKHCSPDELTVYARFNRRGGLDINPYRTSTNRAAKNSRLWRQ